MTRVHATILPEPFKPKYQTSFPAGVTLAEIIETAPALHSRDPHHLVVKVGGEPREGYQPELLRHVKPRPGLNNVVTITPREGLGPKAFSAASGALNLGSSALSFIPIIGPFAAAAAQTIGGSLLEGLRRQDRPGASEGSFADTQTNQAGISINPPKFYQPIPEVFGTMKISPPPGAPSWTEIDNDDVIANALLVTEGEGEWSDIRVNGSPISSFAGATSETREGTDADTNIQLNGADLPTLVQDNLNIEFGDWAVEAQDDATVGTFRRLTDQSDPSTSRPDAIVARAKPNAEAIWLFFTMPNGFRGEDVDVGTGFVIELSDDDGATWRTLPYIHMAVDAINKLYRFYIELRFEADPGSLPTGIGQPWDEILKEADVPAAFVGDDTNNTDLVADTYFGTGPGAASHVAEFNEHLVIYLDPNDATDPWPVGDYLVRIEKGYSRSPKAPGTGQKRYHNVFNQSGVKSIESFAEGNFSISKTIWSSITSEFAEYPIAAGNLAQLFVRAPNVQINDITAVFKRKIPIWDGADWNTVAISDNPAAIIRHIWTDEKLADPVPSVLVDDAAMGEFYDHCVTEGLKYNAYFEDGNVHALAARVAKLAKAKIIQGDKWRVWYDDDRSAEAPVAAITAHNSSGLRLRDPRRKIPHGYKVRYLESAENYAQKDRLVFRDGFTIANATDVRAFDGSGLTTAAEVDDVVGYLLAEEVARSTLISATLPIEGRLIDRGDLIAVNSDVVSEKFGSARIVSIQTSGPNVIGITLDATLPLTAIANDWYGPDDFYSPADMYAPGNKAGVVMMYSAPNPAIVTKEINETADTKVVTFATAFTTPTNLEVGNLVWCGPLNSEQKRMYVLSKQGGRDQTVEVTCMKEANELVT